ncbi:hypothetical protein BpHYR1_018210 [Brachionus plicatilis]|uniref:Uncharacterized protein n=1 Tax=Brachionus plicatilis TaxID=10195 RepID=A0A3M7S305_BRAPC|nr:hypothetical protein BpHYR1_018210 [Brachionus plicatilis]
MKYCYEKLFYMFFFSFIKQKTTAITSISQIYGVNAHENNHVFLTFCSSFLCFSSKYNSKLTSSLSFPFLSLSSSSLLPHTLFFFEIRTKKFQKSQKMSKFSKKYSTSLNFSNTFSNFDILIRHVEFTKIAKLITIFAQLENKL